MSEDYEMMCGIEIHQQLDTKKLFCSCDSHLCDDGEGAYFRRLRPTTSEMGEVDRAALAQFQRHSGYRYQCCRGTTCLVELDEEPPHDVNPDAMEIRDGDRADLLRDARREHHRRDPFHEEDRRRRIQHLGFPEDGPHSHGRVRGRRRQEDLHPLRVPRGGCRQEGRDDQERCRQEGRDDQERRGPLQARPSGDPAH